MPYLTERAAIKKSDLSAAFQMNVVFFLNALEAYSDLSPKLKNQFKISAANVAVPIPPKLKLPN